MVKQLPAHTRVMVFTEDAIAPIMRGRLMDPPTTYGDNYQIIPDDTEHYPNPFLVPEDMVHPERTEPPDTSPVTPTHDAILNEAKTELAEIIATARRYGIRPDEIRKAVAEILEARGD